MILLIDNYDSFVYNVARYCREIGEDVVVRRNDQLTLEDIEALKPSHIIISPGPCTPLEAGVSNAVIETYGGKIPILGICLGHQCIGHVFGAKVPRAKRPCHGKTSLVEHNGQGIFSGLPNPLRVTRYHSLIVTDLPDTLQATAMYEGEIMALQHRDKPIYGVQFHPEAVLTERGHDLIKNFVSYSRHPRENGDPLLATK